MLEYIYKKLFAVKSYKAAGFCDMIGQVIPSNETTIGEQALPVIVCVTIVPNDYSRPAPFFLYSNYSQNV